MSDSPNSNPAPLVSIIIPAYNVASLLPETARSVLAQTVTELQLVIVDDGSTDSTREVAESIGDPRVRVITGPNGGRADARNRGFAVADAAAEYVAFLDADDLWNAEKLERQIQWLRRHPEACGVGCRMSYLSVDGRVLGVTGQGVDDEARERVRSGALLPFPISSFLVRRRAVVAIGGFDATLQEAEDRDFFAKVAAIGDIDCLPEVLGSYRIHGGSASVTRRALMEMSVRFVRARIAAREAGGDLSWETFAQSYRPGWRQRRNDLVRAWYRSAALAYANRSFLRAAAFGLLAAVTNPRYTLSRVYGQRLRRGKFPVTTDAESSK